MWHSLCDCGHHLGVHHVLVTVQTCWSVRTGTTRVARCEDDLKPSLERSVWAVMDDDEVHRFTACEAFHRKDYRKLDACGTEM